VTKAMQTYEAALDTAGARAVFAVRATGDTDGPIWRMDVALGRESAGLLPAIVTCCEAGGVALGAITRWSVGMGPGSFTGIRVGASLAMGLVAGREARLRGLPSGLLLLGGLDVAAGERLAVLNDGRRGQAIVSRFSYGPDGFARAAEPLPVALADLPALAVDRFVLRADDPMADALPQAVRDRLTLVQTVDAAHLFAPAGFPWADDPADDAATIDPAYVRPAVFVPPAPPPLAV